MLQSVVLPALKRMAPPGATLGNGGETTAARSCTTCSLPKVAVLVDRLRVTFEGATSTV